MPDCCIDSAKLEELKRKLEEHLKLPKVSPATTANRILQENSVPIRVLTTRACATLIALKFSFRANVPFLNHNRGAKTFRMMGV